MLCFCWLHNVLDTMHVPFSRQERDIQLRKERTKEKERERKRRKEACLFNTENKNKIATKSIIGEIYIFFHLLCNNTNAIEHIQHNYHANKREVVACQIPLNPLSIAIQT